VADFVSDTAVRANGAGAFDCTLSPDWWVVTGPNGGYLGAIIVRALDAAAAGGSRPLRSLTIHYLRAPAAGPARVAVDVERRGRSVTFARARLLQDERPCALALAVLADAREGLELERAEPPQVPPPEELETVPERPEVPPFGRRFETRPAVGGGFLGGGDDALVGGWLRLRHESPLDAALLVALCDSWFPAVFAVTREPIAVPTLELTVHLRARLPRDGDWVLGRFATRTARDGFLEEDGELYARDGELLAQSRQLALSI
jgi:acyl-CoA thioesterase